MYNVYPVSEISLMAASILSNCPDGKIGTIHSVFNSSCNIKLTEGPILTIQTAKVAKTPMSLCLPQLGDIYSLSFKPGEPVFFNSVTNGLKIGGNSFFLRDAQKFSTYISIKKHEIKIADYKTSLGIFFQQKPAKLYDIIMGDASENITPIEKALANEISKALNISKQGFLNQDENLIVTGISKLLGLGMGLTPSGDDLLLGFLTILSIKKNYSIMIENIKHQILGIAKKSTTEISCEFINYFFKHNFAMPVFHLIVALNEDNLVLFEKSLPIISSIGHSSGQDFLTGLFFGLDFFEGNISSANVN
ncbi:MAG: DUF2877 domain-containing protein [Bacillota bacterium]